MQNPKTTPIKVSTITRECGNSKCTGGIICWGDSVYECDDCAKAKKADKK